MNRLFDHFAPLYDLGVSLLGGLLGGERRIREGVVSRMEPLKGRRVLEVFCGTATLSLMASDRGARVTGVDISEGMLRIAREKAERRGRVLSLVRGDGVSLPFKGSVFDRVVISLGLHEVCSESVKGVLGEVLRVLKPGGRTIIFDFHRADGMAGVLQRIFFIFAEGETARMWMDLDIQSLLGRLGFRNFRRDFLAKGALQILTVERP